MYTKTQHRQTWGHTHEQKPKRLFSIFFYWNGNLVAVAVAVDNDDNNDNGDAYVMVFLTKRKLK